ncbi:MAG: (deoxy)nucleoside triphosphate pyrophosphohydrolase [Spirochaetaceae bacterium]|nr:(deoxy)nucleoside triphosphate pyrophosphohydrolase [Spirochaetaceae bacterium]
MANTPANQNTQAVTPRRVVVAAVIVRRGTVLVAQRDAASRFAGLWEFPGGKVEPGETQEAALRREIREELGVDISVRSEPPISTVKWDYDHARVLLVALRADIVSGTPRPLDHAAIRWIAAEDLTDLPLLPADRRIAARLQAGPQPGIPDPL